MTDLFDDNHDPKPNSEENTPAPNFDSDDILKELVGEGKKFKTVGDLAKSRVKADEFIEQLKAENAEMRRELEAKEREQGKARTIEDVLNAVKEVRGEEGNQSPVSTEDILKAIDSRVSELDRLKARKANADLAQAELLKRFGNDTAKAKEFIRAEAARVGLTPSELKGLSETSPEAFKRILGLNNPTGQGQTGASFVSEVNSESNRGGVGVRNAAYYAELKTKLGPKFWDARIQQQRMRDRESLGSKFYE